MNEQERQKRIKELKKNLSSTDKKYDRFSYEKYQDELYKLLTPEEKRIYIAGKIMKGTAKVVGKAALYTALMPVAMLAMAGKNAIDLFKGGPSIGSSGGSASRPYYRYRPPRPPPYKHGPMG